MLYLFIVLVCLGFVLAGLVFVKSLRVPGKLRRAEELLEQGNLNEAGNILRGILEKSKDNVKAHYLRALILIEQKQYLLAISELNLVLSLPDFKTYVNELNIHYSLADMYKLTNNFQKEIDEYHTIISLNPDDINANSRIGLSLYNKREYKKSLDYLLKSVTKGPQPSPCLLPLGIVLYHLNDYEKAEQYLLSALESNSENDECKFYLGCIYKLQKAYERAVNMFMQAQDGPFYVRSLRMLADIYFEQERYDDVIACLEPRADKLNDITEDGLAYRYLLAESYEIKSRIKDAMAQWESVTRTNPDYREAKVKLEAYKNVLNSEHIMEMLSMNSEELQDYINEIISVFNYTIISKSRISANEYQYKALNTKRMGDLPVLIIFSRTITEINDRQLNELDKRMVAEKCKTGLYITTASFSLKAQAEAPSRQIELYDGDFVSKAIDKIKTRNFLRKK
ncbi:MAG: tetratricopeptide repeat protein [Spirochaetia bacterium]|jgi:tetratricopeptide (TPR) repeat protein|nr:tetratricopeptide repeat protein [Spirochaetia bacterium]